MQVFINTNTHKVAQDVFQIFPAGIHLIGGLNGEGKTSTMMDVFNSLTVDARERSAIVDNPKAHLDASKHLVDTFIIDEIRNPESARYAVDECLAGRRVLSTIHGQNIKSIVRRYSAFMNNELESKLCNSLRFILCQKLVKLDGKIGEYIPVYEALHIPLPVNSLDEIDAMIDKKVNYTSFLDCLLKYYDEGLLTEDDYKRQRSTFEECRPALGETES